MSIKRRTVIIVIAMVIVVLLSIVFYEELEWFYFMKFSSIDVNKAKNIMGNIPDEVLEDIKTNRYQKTKSRDEIIDTFKSKFMHKIDLSKEPSLDYTQNEGDNDNINIDKAIEDMDFLFQVLKNGYVGYKYFGGDEKFSKAKENIIKELYEYKETLEEGTLKEVLCNYLDFIQDGHFAIGGRQICKDFYLFINERYELVKEKSKYFIIIDNEKKAIKSINNDEPGKFIKPSINDEGYIVYRFATLNQNHKDTISINISVEGKDDCMNIELNNLSKKYKPIRDDKVYEYKTVANIPVIKLGSFRDYNVLEQFVKDGEKARKEDLLIIDLRGNKGGNAKYAVDWIENFTKEKYTSSEISASLNTNTAKQALYASGKKFYSKDDFTSFKEQIDEYFASMKMDADYSGWSEVDYEDFKYIENDKLIFVLVDNYTSSAGEFFARALSNMENTIIIGSNSSGTENFGNMGLYILPNSKIEVMFGSLLSVNYDLKITDGLGIIPDLWVNPKDAHYRVIRLIHNYSK